MSTGSDPRSRLTPATPAEPAADFERPPGWHAGAVNDAAAQPLVPPAETHTTRVSGVAPGSTPPELRPDETVAHTERLEFPGEQRLTSRPGEDRVIELREEELVAHKSVRELGEIHLRTRVEEVPRRLEVEALQEEVIVEHVPVGQVVEERQAPWEDNGTLIVPIYEEQLVLVKRLVMREQLHIRRAASKTQQVFEETLRRERLEIDDPAHTGLVHERYPTEGGDTASDPQAHDEEEPREEGGLLDRFVRKAFL